MKGKNSKYLENIFSLVHKEMYLKDKCSFRIFWLWGVSVGEYSACIWDTLRPWAGLVMDILKVDALARQKNLKCQFFRAIGNSFHEVTHIGLEPHQIFSY